MENTTPKTTDTRDTRGRGGNTGGSRRGGPGGNSRRPERAKPEFDHKVVSVRRVTRVVSGGRRFSFSVTLVAGDRKGRVGVGIGKAGDTSLAINKALNAAKKNMFTVPLTKDMAIRHDTEGKFDASVVTLRPAPGRGLVAGSSVRVVLDLAGIKNTGSKVLSRSKNKLNNAKAAILALKKLQTIKK